MNQFNDQTNSCLTNDYQTNDCQYSIPALTPITESINFEPVLTNSLIDQKNG